MSAQNEKIAPLELVSETRAREREKVAVVGVVVVIVVAVAFEKQQLIIDSSQSVKLARLLRAMRRVKTIKRGKNQFSQK